MTMGQTLLNLGREQVLTKLSSSVNGLTNAEAQKRLSDYGPNEIIQKRYRSLFLQAISHSTNPLIAILLFAAAISAFTGNITSAVIIIVMVLISIILDYFQSHRSLLAAKRLQERVAATASVLRDGKWVDILRSRIVPGDIIRLVAGNMVPADALLLQSKDLHVQQAALTGESLPAEKEVSETAVVSNNPAEITNAVFSGSSIVSGVATAIVLATGQSTLFGQIAKSLSLTPPPTEFDKGIERFGFFIMKTVTFLVLFVFVINIFLKHSAIESLLFAIALAVGLTPELLPMITTVTLASGAMRMAKKHVIVKNLSAIQNFGSIDILCSDKTGTLTSGEMILTQEINMQEKASQSVLLLAYLNSLYGTGIQNPFNIAVLKKININPLDAAILKHDHPDVQSYTKVDEIPFDFERRCSSVVVDKSGSHLLITKGAPESIFKLCTSYDIENIVNVFDDESRNQYAANFQSLSSQGFRVLAVAYRKMPVQPAYNVCDEKEMVFAGFLTFADPPLKDAANMIAELQKSGVSIKVITGDNELVARHVCQQVGLDPSKILMSDELEHMTDPALGQIAEQVQVFARISPAQKQRIIATLRTRGHVVGYIGDGINDAPSLHTADVGISVSGAVDVAREAADIILLKRDLRVLHNGIIEGRKSFGNVMKYLMMGTSSNFGNMLSMVVAVAFLPFLPMLPVQILLNNLLYDVSQVTIPTDHVDQSFILKPKHWKIDIIRKFMFYIGPISSIFDFLTFYVMLKVFEANEALFQTGWFVESLATQTLVIFVIRTAKNPWQSKPSLPLITTVLSMVAIGILIPFSPIANDWGFVPLPADYFIFLLLATLIYLGLVEVIKQKLMWRWLEKSI